MVEITDMTRTYMQRVIRWNVGTDTIKSVEFLPATATPAPEESDEIRVVTTVAAYKDVISGEVCIPVEYLHIKSRDAIRKEALAKLTDDEIKALGLDK